MRKIISVFCIIAILLSVSALTVSATPKDDIIAAADANFPKDVVSEYRTQGINILNQFDVTEDKANQVIAIIKEVAPKVKSGVVSLSEYSAEDRAYLLSAFDRVCTILGLTYKYTTKSAGDDLVYLYGPDGKLIAELDGDAIKDTGAASNNSTTLIALLSVLAVVAVLSVGYGVKKTAVRV